MNKKSITNQIIIEIGDNVRLAYELFEGIQNKYSLYDNCVLDGTEEEKEFVIRIEGKNINEVKKLFNKIRKEFKLPKKSYIKKSVPIEDTILDEDRKEETGELEV